MLGQFCHLCGEKKFDNEDLSVKTVSQHIFSSMTDVDGKLISSFWLLISKPGQLTKDYMSGVRVKRLSPFQMLLMANIVFYLMAAIVGSSVFTTKLNFHTNATNFIHQAAAKKMVDEKIISSGENKETYTKRFNAMVEVQAKSLVMLIVPMLALLVFFLYVWQKKPVIGSLVFATHIFTFMLLINAFAVPLIPKVGFWVINTFSLDVSDHLFELIYSSLMFTMIGACFYLSARRYFNQNRVLSMIKTIVFIFSIYWIYLIYRMVLFFTTFYAL